MVRPLARDEDALSPFWSFIGVLIVVFVVLAVYFGAIVPKFPPPAPRALPGDTVGVDYVGTFEDGLVFDTSLASVAVDNASFPKAFSFSWRGSWSPLSFEIGKQPPAVIRGFEDAVQGLAVGDTITVRVPPDRGYGPADPAKIQVKPLFESVPARVTMNASAFRAAYGTDAVGGSIVKDPFWGWTATVDVASVDRVGHRTGGSSGTVEFTVTAVDLAAGTYTLNFNDPTKGRVLVFQVTLVHITSV